MGSIIDRIDAQKRHIDTMELCAKELFEIRLARRFIYTTAMAGCVIGTIAGYIMSLSMLISVLMVRHGTEQQ